MYIFGYSNQVENRVAFYTFQKERVLKINIYLNRDVKDVNYENILNYIFLKMLFNIIFLFYKPNFRLFLL